MAKRTIEWESKGTDKVVADVKKVTDAEGRLSKATKGLEEQAKATKVAIKDLSDDAQKRLKELQDATTKKMESHAKAIKGVAAAVGVAVAAAAKFISAYAETEGVIDRLRRTLESSAEGVDNVNAALKRATDTFRDWHQFGVSTAEMAAALDQLVRTTGDYDQSMQDVSLALDIAAGSGWDFQRAAEAVVRVRRGEVDVLKDLGVLTKDQTDALNSMTNETDRTRTAIVELHKAFGGDAIGTKGVQSALDETIVKLGETEEALGRIANTLLESGTGVVSAVGEFLGLLEEGQHPLDGFNARLNQLAQNFEDEGLLAGIAHVGIGIAGMVNPLAAVAGMAILSSPDEEAAAPSAGGAAPRGPRPDNYFGWAQVDEVPEPQEPEARKEKAAKPSRPDPNRGSDALTGADAPTDAEVWQAIWEKAYYDDAKAQREAYQEKKAADLEYAKHLEEVDERRAAAARRSKEDQEKIEEEQRALRKEANAKNQEMAFAAAEAATGLANSFIKDEGAKAIIEGGMQVAYAIAKAANPATAPQAIGHAAAAVQFFAVAAQAGVGGGAAKKAAPTGAGRASALPKATREQADLLGETGPSAAAVAPITVNYHSVWPPTPQQVKETRRLLDADGRRDV